ncbi:MAG: alpha/beta fold hydrolase [archaeon]|nr:alpha/beta fold hydrolase [archaeon]
MKERRVSVFNDFDEKLVGIETTPSIQKEKYSTVILAHGFGVKKEESGMMFVNLAKSLSGAGFLVYRFDFSGCGESEGDYSETSLSKLKSDLSRILDFVKSRSNVDVSNVGIVGQSFGTATIITLKPEVRCLVMMGSILNPKEILIKLFGEGYNPEGISTRVKPNRTITKIKPQFWKDFDNHNLPESIKKIHCPVLFVHGSEDEKAPVSGMELYFKNANEPKKKVIIEGGDHGFRPHKDKMYKIVVEWFKKYLI